MADKSKSKKGLKKSASSKSKAKPQSKAQSQSKPKMSRKNMEKAAGAAALLAALGLGAYGVSKSERGKAAIARGREKAGHAKESLKGLMDKLKQKLSKPKPKQE